MTTPGHRTVDASRSPTDLSAWLAGAAIQVADRATHDYPIPAGAPMDLKGGTTVLVYCHAFNVAFGNATLASG